MDWWLVERLDEFTVEFGHVCLRSLEESRLDKRNCVKNIGDLGGVVNICKSNQNVCIWNQTKRFLDTRDKPRAFSKFIIEINSSTTSAHNLHKYVAAFYSTLWKTWSMHTPHLLEFRSQRTSGNNLYGNAFTHSSQSFPNSFFRIASSTDILRGITKKGKRLISITGVINNQESFIW